MERNTIVAGSIGLVVVLAAIGAAVYFMGDTKPTDTSTATPDGIVGDESTDRFGYITRIDAVQFYEDGTHVFVGEIDMPTPCDLLEADAVVMESFPEQIVLNFSVINHDADDMLCAQVITPQRFMVEVVASEEATVSAQFMGRSVELNLRESQPGETPDDFELFIKG